MAVIAQLMGLDEAAGFRQLYGTVVAAATSNMQGDPEIAARGDAARADVYDMLRSAIEARRRDPGDDLLSELCTMEVDGSPLPDDEVLAYALFLFVAGVETTERTLCNFTRHAVDHPQDWQRLARDRALVLSAIAETLRFAPPVHGLTRGVALDAEINGTAIPAGSKVLAVIAAANRDPEVFADPETFRIGRSWTTRFVSSLPPACRSPSGRVCISARARCCHASRWTSPSMLCSTASRRSRGQGTAPTIVATSFARRPISGSSVVRAHEDFALPARGRVTIEPAIDGEEPPVGPRGVAVDDLHNESGRSFRLVPTRDAHLIRPP